MWIVTVIDPIMGDSKVSHPTMYDLAEHLEALDWSTVIRAIVEKKD